MSQAGDVRNILKEGPADFSTIAARLDIAKMDRRARKVLRATLTDLREVGIVTFVDVVPPGAPPQYRLAGRTDTAGVQAKMARAVKLKGKQNRPITCKDLAALSGCTQEYAGRYLRFLKQEKYLLPGEAVKLSRFGLGLTYRVAPGREKAEPPHWSRRTEERKAIDPCAECRERIGGVLGEMRQTLTAISGGAELVLGMVSELEAGLPGFRQQSDAEADIVAARASLNVALNAIEAADEELEALLNKIRRAGTPAPQEAKDGPEDHHES